MLNLTECDRFCYDAAAADRTVRFIEKYCRHFVGKHAGEPFILQPIQRKIVNDIFGWKQRADGLRRFRDVYWDAPVGTGKSPLMAAIGLYGMIADNEPGAEIYSLASTSIQAAITFDTARQFIRQDRMLRKLMKLTQFRIDHPASASRWKKLSGKGLGGGAKPHIGLADEAHDWLNGEAYLALRERMNKRRQPLMFVSTNTPESEFSFCHTLREQAEQQLDSDGMRYPWLYPIIWAADESARTDDPDAYRSCNPMLGITISLDKVMEDARTAIARGREAEDRHRRLNLGIVPRTRSSAWLDLQQWDACTVKADQFDPPADAPMFIGADLSLCDDLSAVVETTVTPDAFYVRPHFWMPRVTAERYQSQHAVDYLRWAEQGHITLIDQPTIDSSTHTTIAQQIIQRHGKTKRIQAVCYDACKAMYLIAALEAAGLTCVPIRQGYSVSPGCFELERRVKSRSIVLLDNPVMKFCASNAEAAHDSRGNLWVVKPGSKADAKGNGFKGQRWRKIDGISALVTSLTEAAKFSFPAAKKLWKGTACLVKRSAS